MPVLVQPESAAAGVGGDNDQRERGPGHCRAVVTRRVETKCGPCPSRQIAVSQACSGRLPCQPNCEYSNKLPSALVALFCQRYLLPSGTPRAIQKRSSSALVGSTMKEMR